MSSCDCGTADKTGPALKPMEEALELLLGHAKAVGDIETVPTGEALGRVLAAPVSSQVEVPPWDNSAMDGYALRSGDLPAADTSLPVSQRIPAGAAAEPLEPGTAARIFTGAPVPAGADAVVIQEVCCRDGDRVTVGPTWKIAPSLEGD